MAVEQGVGGGHVVGKLFVVGYALALDVVEPLQLGDFQLLDGVECDVALVEQAIVVQLRLVVLDEIEEGVYDRFFHHTDGVIFGAQFVGYPEQRGGVADFKVTQRVVLAGFEEEAYLTLHHAVVEDLGGGCLPKKMEGEEEGKRAEPQSGQVSHFS